MPYFYDENGEYDINYTDIPDEQTDYEYPEDYDYDDIPEETDRYYF